MTPRGSCVSSCLPGGDRLGQGDRSARLLDMQRLDEAALDADGALAGGDCFGIAGDDPARPRHLRGGRREDLLCRADLIGVDYRLAAKAQIPALMSSPRSPLRLPPPLIYP